MSVDERLKYFRAFIMLVAGLIILICDIVNKVGLTRLLIDLLVVMIVFYIIAGIVVWAIKKALAMPDKAQLAKELEISELEAGEEGSEDDALDNSNDQFGTL